MRVTTLPGVRTFLLIMTIVGGLLALVAAGWVARLSAVDRRRKRSLYRLGDQYGRELMLHSRKYQAYGNQLDRHRRGEGLAPVPPFGGMDEKAHSDLVTAEYLRRVQAHGARSDAAGE